MIVFKNLHKSYPMGKESLHVLKGLDLNVKEGEMVVINGSFQIDSALQIIAKPSMMNPEGGRSSTGHEAHGHMMKDMQTIELSGTESISQEQLLEILPVYLEIQKV